jgi:hypothetical protein
MRAWATTGDEAYDMVTIEKAADWLRDTGYTDIVFEDRNAWYRSFARDEYERLMGPLHSTYAPDLARSTRQRQSKMHEYDRCWPIKGNCDQATFAVGSRTDARRTSASPQLPQFGVQGNRQVNGGSGQ